MRSEPVRQRLIDDFTVSRGAARLGCALLLSAGVLQAACGDNNGGSGGSGASSSATGTVVTSAATGGFMEGPWTPGITATSQTELPGDGPIACEWDWTIRLLAPYQHYAQGHAPRRMYFETCNTDTLTPLMFSSYTIGAKEDGEDATTGALTVSMLNPETGALEVQQMYHFPECRSLHGVAAADDCSTVAVLCRIDHTQAPNADHDAIANHPNADWLTNEHECGNTNKMNQHMWLYEWPDGDLTKQPVKVIVHKSIGSWEYGQNYLRYGEGDNSYGIALKATTGQDPCHEGDSYLVLDRDGYQFTDRGWDWGCATGHTIHNRPAYNPVSRKYAMLCSTDWNQPGTQDEVEVAFHREDQPKSVIQHIPRYNALWIKGGAGPLIPRTDAEGFIGIIVGEPPPGGAGYDDTTPVELGFVSFDGSGAQQGEVKWIAKHDVAYYSWPQLAPLGGDRYLLGWGEGYHAGTKEDQTDRDLSLRIPWTYWTMEIDGEGNPLTEPTEVTDAGWGEVNEMVPLGDGRVAWSYVPDARRTPDSNEVPRCDQSTLVHYVYTSETEPE